MIATSIQLLKNRIMCFWFENLQICNFASNRLIFSMKSEWQILKTSGRFLSFNKFYALFESFMNVFGVLLNIFLRHFWPLLCRFWTIAMLLHAIVVPFSAVVIISSISLKHQGQTVKVPQLSFYRRAVM